MAHEIAHVAARHAVENQTKGSLLEYAAIAGSIFIGGIPGMIYQNTAGIGLLGIFMKFSRSAEEEADKLGVQYMYAAGYDPGAMATMFEKLEAKNKKKPGFIARAFASHPALKVAPTVEYGAPAVTAIAWTAEAEDRVKRIPAFVRGMVVRAVEEKCAREGIAAVTVEVLEELRARMPKGPRDLFRP